jgi:hypothetical protein
MIKPDFTQPVPADLGVVHFIGIGGSVSKREALSDLSPDTS